VKQRIHVRIYGTVQGVGFRAFTARHARQHNIAGYARNCPDGSVQVEAEGDPASLNAFREALQQGPAYASVRQIDEVATTTQPLPRPFSVAY
jgi:acylphosphatase